MYRSAGPNWRIQVNSSGYIYLSGKLCNTILKFRTFGTRYSSRRLRVPLVRKHSQFYSLSSVTLFWRQKAQLMRALQKGNGAGRLVRATPRDESYLVSHAIIASGQEREPELREQWTKLTKVRWKVLTRANLKTRRI